MSNVGTRIHYVDSESKWLFERIQDVEPTLELNKALQKEKQSAEWGRLLGVIPNVMIEKWIIEDGVDYLRLPAEEFGRLVKRKLRDPQYAFLRSVDKI